MMEESWTSERIEELKRRREAGESYSVIGAAMNLSRGAISGKVDRLDLIVRRKGRSEFEIAESLRKNADRNAENQRLRRARARVKEVKEMAEPIAAMPAYGGSQNIPFADLRDYSPERANQCRFIADEPPGPEYFACGTATQPGESYCDHCRPVTRMKSTLTQTQRALYIRMGVRKHLRALREATL